MRDLIFNNEAGSVTVSYRTDLVNSGSDNFTVMQIHGVDNQQSSATAEEKALLAAFQQLPYNLYAFKKFATDNDLQLISQDSTGSDKIILVDFPEPSGSSAS